MTLMLKRKGKEMAPDWDAFAESLTPAQVGLLWNALQDVIENQDSTVILQIYAASANRWQQYTARQRKDGAEEGEHRFFSEEALERDDRERRAARSLVDEQRESGILLTDGDTGGPVH